MTIDYFYLKVKSSDVEKGLNELLDKVKVYF